MDQENIGFVQGVTGRSTESRVLKRSVRYGMSSISAALMCSARIPWISWALPLLSVFRALLTSLCRMGSGSAVQDPVIHNITRISSSIKLFIAATRSLIIDHKDFVIQTFEELGFNINYGKSSLNPKTQVEYIGYIIDTDNVHNVPWLSIGKQRIRKLKKDINRSLQVGQISARMLAKIAGQAVSMSRAILPGKLKLRSLYRVLSTLKLY